MLYESLTGYRYIREYILGAGVHNDVDEGKESEDYDNNF